eukprot:2386816-Rhodomonas_salina.1
MCIRDRGCTCRGVCVCFACGLLNSHSREALPVPSPFALLSHTVFRDSFSHSQHCQLTSGCCRAERAGARQARNVPQQAENRGCSVARERNEVH